MNKIDNNKELPTIHGAEIVAKSKFFKVEKLDLEFSNGAVREFERIVGGGRGAVM
ncbi:MAG: ADP compounds hydrolase NudE, partial [Glaciecola sp.]